MSFFRDRLEAYPRSGRLPAGQGGGVLAVLQDGRERLDAPVHHRGQRLHQLRLEQLPEPLVPPEGHRGRPGRHPPLRHRRHRLPSPQRHPRPPPHARGRAGRVLRARGRAGVLHRLRGQREHHQRPPEPPRLRGPRQGRAQLAAHRRPALRRHHEALRSQRRRAAHQDPRRPAGGAGQGRHRRRRLLDGRRHRSPRRDGRAVPSLREHVPPRRRGPRTRRARRAWSRCRRAVRRARHRRPRHHHLLEDARVVRRRADRLAPTRSSCSPSTPIRSSSPRRTRPARSPPRSRRCASCAARPT